MKYISLLEKIKKDIEKAKIVSFDVFDTLLLRPYLEPTDLFLHIEKSEEAPFFCNARIEAEREARRKRPQREDIFFDDIYEEIDTVFKPLKQVELDFEMKVLQQNSEMKQVWDYAKSKNKKIVIASDMYLSTEFIAESLKKNGFSDYDKIYVSGELGKTKSRGSMYEHIINELEAQPCDIVHIGDNKHSDYTKSKSHGINGVLYKQVAKQYLKNSVRVEYFKKTTGSDLGKSILIAILAIRWQKNQLGILKSDYWSGLGYEYAGPVAYGYSRWIASEVEKANINNLLFVARDGYTLQKIYSTFNTTTETNYIYAPRILNLTCRLDYAKENIKQSGAIIDYFNRLNPEIMNAAEKTIFKTWQDYHNFIQNNKSIFEESASKEHQAYKNYLLKTTHTQDSRIGVVDTITGEFSSQKLIQNTLEKETLGFYWSVINIKGQRQYNHKMFRPNNTSEYNWSQIYTKNWDFMEFLLTSPEFPIKRMALDGTPIYDDTPSKFEKIRSEIYPSISDNAVTFANDIKDIFGSKDIYLTSSILIEWINCFIENPTKKDIVSMQNIKHAYDSGHQVYMPLFTTKFPFSYILRHPKNALNIAKKLVWRTVPQTIAVCIASPLKIRMRGFRMLKISFFPKLKNRYFTLSLNISERCYYQFIIGNEKEH
ncbi:HAD-IA family hydrolase [Pectobacterium aquaticum]|nr:HAD-IA family hydrolase [Pectobacterium aquaticum]MBN3063663.1 HAD-IA family hydrolase [Pectobacterium aquaticum]